jgi:DegV family protein with EDD domain
MDYPTTLITDSTCDIPANLVEKYKVAVIPQIILWERETFRDRVDLQPEAFYRRLAAGRSLPTTAPATYQDFVNVYRAAADHGAREIVMVTVSSAMSGTYGAARKAAEGVGVPVQVIDSKGLSMSLGWQVLAAARLRAAGGRAAEMIETMDQVRRRLVMIASLDTLEYLRRGGRIGNASWLAGRLLNIKPLIRINPETGMVESAGRVRTRQRALEVMFEQFLEGVNPAKPLRIAVLHGNALDEARAMVEIIQHELCPVELLMNTTGPALGIHAGPRALALCGYTEE